MSKNKDFEKKLEKEIEKIKPEKEHIKIEKIEKHEHKEYKEPIKEKIEHKEKIEIKEFKREKLEQKEIAKLERPEKEIFEKGGKELVENVDPGEIFARRAQTEAGSTDAAAMSAAKNAELEKPAKEKDIEKIKREKEFAKIEIKELHKIEKYEIKEKPEKFEKNEKFEKEHTKPEKREKEYVKNEFKEHLKAEIKELNEVAKDFSTEGPGKEIAEGPGDPGERINPFSGTGAPEERLKELEDAVTRLSHFIGVDLRPDLSAGALNKEPDVQAEKAEEDKAGGQKPDAKNKRP